MIKTFFVARTSVGQWGDIGDGKPRDTYAEAEGDVKAALESEHAEIGDAGCIEKIFVRVAAELEVSP